MQTGLHLSRQWVQVPPATCSASTSNRVHGCCSSGHSYWTAIYSLYRSTGARSHLQFWLETLPKI